MSDLEMTELCLIAMGWKHLGAVGIEPPKRGEPDPKGLWCLSGGNDWWINPEGHSVCAPCSELPDPLHDDAQAMALVKNVELMIWPPRFNKGKVNWIVRAEDDNQNVIAQTTCPDLNRAIVECVAKMEASVNDPT